MREKTAGGARPAWGSGGASIIALLIIGGLGLPIRLIAIGTPFTGYHSWNEAHYAMIAGNFAISGPFVQYDDMGLDSTTTPFVPWLIAGSWAIFGRSEWAARLPILLCGLLTLWFFFLLARRLYGPAAAVVAVAMAVAVPDIVYFSRNVQLDSPMMAGVFGTAVALLKYRTSGRWPHWILLLAALCLAYLSKWTVPLFLPMLLALWLWQPVGGEALPTRLTARRAACALIVPPLPGIVWTIWSVAQAPRFSLAQLAAHFNRGYEFSWPALGAALRAIAPRLAADLSILWLPLLLGLPWLIVTWRRHLPVLLLLATSIAPLRYPLSYKDNLYYLYPALYGLALLCAAICLAGAQTARNARGRRLAVAVIATFVLLAGAFSVQNYLYFIRQNTGLFLDKAGLASSLDRPTGVPARTLVMSSWFFPQLMYYAGGDARNVLADEIFAACFRQQALFTSHFYHSVLFSEAPPTPMQRQLLAWGYRPSGHDLLWQLAQTSSSPPQAETWLAAPVTAAIPGTCSWLDTKARP